jgi:ribosomal protein S18 acetylase RimI-like enzyme
MSTNFILRTAQRDDFQMLAPWLATIGQPPQHQCLHTWSGENADVLCETLLGYWDDGELCYVSAYKDDQLVGAMGSEFDKELGRAWLHGPHAVDEEWEAIAQLLYVRLSAELPPMVRQFDAYLNTENKRARSFYLQQGFAEQDSLNYDFWLAPENRVGAGEAGCQMLDKEQEVSFKELYTSLFPTAYYSGERIIQMIGDSHRVMVLAEGEEVSGFVIVNTTGPSSPGEVQFLGVREDCRRRQYGRRLLLAGIDWLFDVASAPRIVLNVSQELINAQALYESVGFKLRFTGVGLRKML